MTAAYGVTKSVIGASVAFHSRKQQPHETIEAYSRELNQLASKCGYSDCCRDRNIRDVFVSGLRSPKLISALITEGEDKKFHECVGRAKTIEQVLLDVEDINPTEATDKFLPQNKLRRQESQQQQQYRQGTSQNVIPPDYKCIRCGQIGKHFAHECFALNKTCFKCKKTGHLSSVCRSKLSTSASHKLEENEDFNSYAVLQKITPLPSKQPPRERVAEPAVGEQLTAQRHIFGNRFHALQDHCAESSSNLNENASPDKLQENGSNSFLE